MVHLGSIYHMVLASYDLPVYGDMIRLRRRQLERRNLPHVFVLDGPRPKELAYDEVYFERTAQMESTAGPGISEKRFAGLLLKFQSAVRTFLADPALSHLTHCLRLNASTFVNYGQFEQHLGAIPETGCVAGTWFFGAGPLRSWSFLSGTAILFSRDVLHYFAGLDLSTIDVAKNEVDDVALGALLSPRYKLLEAFPMVVMPAAENELGNHPFIRVRNDKNRDVKDRAHWQALMRMFEGEDAGDLFCPETAPRKHATLMVVMGLLLLLILGTGFCLKF
jgi:hypothetical protein